MASSVRDARFHKSFKATIVVFLLAGCAGVEAERKPEPRPADALWFVQSMADIVREKNRLILDSLPDCEQTLDKTLRYVEANLTRMREVADAFRRFEDRATDQEKLEATRRIFSSLGPHFEASVEAQKKFNQQCPDEQRRLKNLIRNITGAQTLVSRPSP